MERTTTKTIRYMKEDKYLVCIDNSNTIMLHESINPVNLTIGKSYKII